jgi:excisionase family DNA binding protein
MLGGMTTQRAAKRRSKPPSLPGEWISLAEAADFLRVSPRTVQRLVKDGRLTAYRLRPSSPPRFKAEDIERAAR